MKQHQILFGIALAMASSLAAAQPDPPKPSAGDPFQSVKSPPNTTTVNEQPVLGAAKKTDLAIGRYRFSGKCEKVWLWGQKEQPVCDQFAGMIVMETGKPQFFFPFKSKEKLWVFVAKAEVARDGNRVTYEIEKVYNKEFGAEFKYDAAECVVDLGPNFECRIWQDKERTKPVYELIYKGDGNWQRAPLQPASAPK